MRRKPSVWFTRRSISASTSSTLPTCTEPSPTFDRPGVPPAAEREPAEQILGRALAGRRDEVVIATKCGERRFDPAAGLSRRYIIQQVEQSLRRLGTDYIDLYYAHFPDPDTPLDQTLLVYDDLVRQGKLRYVALSNYPAWQVTQAMWIADDRRLAAAPVCVQVKYNLIDRAAEHELAPACVQFGLSIVPFGPLHGGLLASTQVRATGIPRRQEIRRVWVHGNRDRDRPCRRAAEPGLGPAAVPGLPSLAALPPSGRVSDRRRRNRGRDHRQRHRGRRQTGTSPARRPNGVASRRRRHLNSRRRGRPGPAGHSFSDCRSAVEGGQRTPTDRDPASKPQPPKSHAETPAERNTRTALMVVSCASASLMS